MKTINRRDFLRSTGICAGCAAMPGMFPSLFTSSAYAAGPNASTVLLVYAGGGPDFLNWVQPMGTATAAALQAVRPDIYIPDVNLHQLAIPGRPAYDFGFHPALTNLSTRFSQGQVAVALACGADGRGTRDHDGETRRVQYGADSVSTINSTGVNSGVLNRAAQKAGFTSAFNLWDFQGGSDATNDGQQLGVTTNGLNGYGFNNSAKNGNPSDNGQGADLLYACNGYYQAQSNLAQFTDWGHQWTSFKANATQIAALNSVAANGFSNTGFGRQMRNFYQAFVGLAQGGVPLVRLASANLGGNDTHSNEVTSNQNILTDLDTNVSNLFTQLAALNNGLASQLIVLVIGEFSRTVKQNNVGNPDPTTWGTDHGYAPGAIVVSDASNLNGGLFGTLTLPQIQTAIQVDALATQFRGADLWGGIFDKMGLPRDQILPVGHNYSNIGIFT